jgi:Ca2+-transporting ATPase
MAALLHVSDPESGLSAREAEFRRRVESPSAWRQTLARLAMHAEARARLRELAIRPARVLRDGDWLAIPAIDLVPGDLIRVRQGDIVPADARLVVVHELFCREAGGERITGKSVREVAVEAPPSRRRSMIFCGAEVLAGSGDALVVATGLDTHAAGDEAAFGQRRPIQGEPVPSDARE